MFPDFPWPSSNGAWLAWLCAATTSVFGLLMFFAPRITLRLLRLKTTETHPEALSEARATMGGFYLGMGLCALLLNHPLVYVTLGAAWLFTSFGRVISMLSDRGNTIYNWALLILNGLLAFFPLAFALGVIS